MTGALSDYLEAQLIDHLFHASNTYTPVATVYLGLLSALPDDTGATEVTYTNYGTRPAITFGAAAGRAITQSGVVTFPLCGVTGDTATHYAIYDAATAGNMLAYGALSASKVIADGNTPSVGTGQVILTAAAGAMSDYLANALLDFAFRNQAYSKPAKHLFLADADPTSASTGSTISEPAGNNYARLAVTGWTTATNTAENTAEETFNVPSGTWGAIQAVGICDAATVGNMLFYDTVPTGEGQTPGNGDTVKFAAGAFDVTLD